MCHVTNDAQRCHNNLVFHPNVDMHIKEVSVQVNGEHCNSQMTSDTVGSIVEKNRLCI